MVQKNQTTLLREYLIRYGHISNAEAMTHLGIGRLSARIEDLRKAGLRIRTEMTDGHNRFGRPIRYAVYWLHTQTR